MRVQTQALHDTWKHNGVEPPSEAVDCAYIQGFWSALVGRVPELHTDEHNRAAEEAIQLIEGGRFQEAVDTMSVDADVGA